jgi:hypothetical protein
MPHDHRAARTRHVTDVFYRGDHVWRHNYSDRPELFLPVAVLFAFGLLVAGLRLVRRKPAAFGSGMLVAWLVLGAVPAVASVDEIHALRSVLMIPAVFLLAGLGADWAWTAVRRRAPQMVCAIVAVVLCLMVAVEPTQSYFGDWAHYPWVARAFDAWLVEAASEIREAPNQATKFVAVPYIESGIEGGIPVMVHTVPYLTRSYTEQEQYASGIRYIVQAQPPRLDPKAFCEGVRAQHAGEQVFCLAYAPDRLQPLAPMR